MDNISLQKSHSKWSNFKLTFLSFLTIISFSSFWISLFSFEASFNLNTIILILSALLSVLFISLFRKFHR